MKRSIQTLTIEGFKSIEMINDFPFRALNILIGGNGSGKSNLISFFRFVRNIMNRSLQVHVQKNGGIEAHLFKGSKFTKQILGRINFEKYHYEFILEPTSDNRLIISNEIIDSNMPNRVRDAKPEFLSRGSEETKLIQEIHDGPQNEIAAEIYPAIMDWNIYHFHDTGDTARIKRPCPINHNERLDEDGGNLAAFLYPLFQKNDDVYRKIRDIIRIAAPFFDDFYLRPLANNPEQIQLEWKQKHLEQPFLASQLSDGTLRFVCLVTALLQPREPSVIIIDEPELGLHPFALSTIANLMKQVSNHTQIIVATQSPTFLDYFDPASIIVIDREQDRSVFKRLEQNQLTQWLKEYTLGELWQKNVLGGSS